MYRGECAKMPRTASTATVVRARNWVLTINNPTDAEKQTKSLFEQTKNVRYACGQHEIGAECGTYHIQGYVEFSKALTLGAVSKLFPRARLAARKGTREQARDYALKQGEHAGDTTGVANTRFEVGEWVQERGKRNDLEEVSKFIKDGGRIEDVYDKWPSIAAKYPRWIDRYCAMKATPRTWETKIIVIKGPTGVGKTRMAFDECPDIWKKPVGGFWFDTYDNHPNVLFDEFDGKESGIGYRDLLQITDRYKMLVPIKGGYVNWAPKCIYITTNVEPEQWYPCQGDVSHLMRRISEIRRIAE